MGQSLLLGLGAGSLLFRHEAFERDARSLLLRLFFGGAFGFGESASTSVAIWDADFDTEEFLVIGATLRGEDVLRLACSSGLQVLLKGRLVVADGSREGVAGAESSVELGHRRLDDVALDEGTRGVETAVEVERGDDGLEGVGRRAGFLRPPLCSSPRPRRSMEPRPMRSATQPR